MKAYTLKLFPLLLIVFTSAAIPAQEIVDTSQINYFLQKAHQQLDSSKVEQALATAKEVEKVMLSYIPENDPRLAEVYSLVGLCFLKTDPSLVQPYLQKVLEMETTASVNGKAMINYFAGTFNYIMGDSDTALKHYQKSLSYYLIQKGAPHSNVIRIYTNYGLAMVQKNNFAQAHDFYRKAIETGLEFYGPFYPVLATPYSNRGVLFQHQGYLKEALKDLEEGLNIRLKVMGPEHSETAISYINLGLVYLTLLDLDRAADYLNKALAIAVKTEKTAFLPYIYTNLGVIFSRQNNHERARQYFEKSNELEVKIFPPGNQEIPISLFNIASTYADEKNYQKAEEYFEKSIEAANADNPNLGRIFGDFGLFYLKQGLVEQAKTNIQKSLDIQLKIHGEQHPFTSDAYFSFANIAKQEGDYQKALQWNNLSKQSLGYFQDGDLNKVSSLLLLGRAFLQESLLHWQFRQNHSERVEAALLAAQRTIHTCDALAKSYLDPFSKFELQKFELPAFEIAIASNLVLKKPHYDAIVFNWLERSKSFLLYEAMQEADALQIAGIPDSLLKNEYNLRIDIAYYDKKHQEKINIGLNETDSTVLKITGKLFDLKREYESLKNQFENNYPEYYKAKYDLSTINLEEVQNNMLQANQSLLEFMVGDSSIFIFLVQKDTFEVHEIKRDFPLKEWVQQLTKEGIYGYYTAPFADRTRQLEDKTIVNYTNAAQQLYEKLIAPVADRLTENLIIIPDGELGYVPFEALLTAAPPKLGAFQAYPFMLKKHQISYCYSATLLHEMRQKRHRKQPSGQLLAMAPFFLGDIGELIPQVDTTDLLAGFSLRDSLGVLRGSGEEVVAINKLWNGTPFYGGEASIAAFQHKAEDYRILHLSTHGKADDRVGDYAYLAFGLPDEKGTFDKLYARDLYNYSLNADMVVLSACETGIGKLQRGEGIISLARAFAYAGAKSIFTTLWQVNDVKTKDLLVGFYKYLKTGKSKEEALRLAKLDYLKDNSGKGTGAHPFFWAGLIGIGDMSPLAD